ncbi:hypothetical protein KSP9073_03481 [Kushneria phyllosphaerae]|uniref:Uncharacterized protein n=1 Tax=Kushneria phyllosphaerae TaxID=2100822 RepID=A0A2R8CR79_9GAMM|nr:hypothetical protein KSP9073_03481 [Kushneria phyllosphaerae]
MLYMPSVYYPKLVLVLNWIFQMLYGITRMHLIKVMKKQCWLWQECIIMVLVLKRIIKDQRVFIKNWHKSKMLMLNTN